MALVHRLWGTTLRHRSPAIILATAALLVFAATGALVMAAPAQPTGPHTADKVAVAVDDPAFVDLRQFMEQIGATEAAIEQLASAAQVPLTPEFVNPFGVAGEVAQPDYLVPRLTVTAELHMPNLTDLSAPGGPLAAGPSVLGEVFYGQGLTAPSGDGWYLYAKTLTAPCAPTGIREYGIVAFDTTPLNGGVAERYAPVTSNLFYGGNVAYVLHADPQNPFSALRYEMAPPDAAQDFATTNSNWIAICGGDTVIGLIPGDEWDGVSDLRFFGYDVPVGNSGQALTTDASQMRVPGVALDAQPADDIAVIAIGTTFTPEPTLLPSEAPTAQPTAAASTDAIPTTQPSATAVAGALSPLPALSPTFQPAPSPTVVPTTAPTIPTSPTAGDGIDPLLLTFLLGLGLIGLSILLFLLSRADTTCEELATTARAAQDECDKARATAAEARARQQAAARDLAVVQHHQGAARANLDDAQKALDHAQRPDDLAVQSDANAQARAEADGAKADARQAWKNAGSRQGASAARLDRQLADIERAVQGKIQHNNDPRNITELREAAAARTGPQLQPLETALAAAQASLDEATASVRSATEAEAAASAALSAAEEHADQVCSEAAAARQQYDECLKITTGVAAKGVAVAPPQDEGASKSLTADAAKGAVAAGAASAVASGDAPLSTAPVRACKDGDESWEPEGPQQTFVVRADGPATRVILWTEPGIKGMEKWINGSSSAAGRRDNEHHPSITSPEIDLISNQRLGQWAAGLRKSGAPPNIEVGFEIECVSRSVQCQRRWVCQGGGWVETADRRADMQTSGRSTRSLNEANVTPSTNAMRGFLNKAKEMVEELKQAEAEAEKAARCE